MTRSGTIWPEITSAARAASRADVAVAYFGKGGARRLPLKKGSRLVVDASKTRVKTGATCPAELLKLHRKGVAIYSRPDLHAKVFVFPRRVFIGSANNTIHSASSLVEAVTTSTDRELIADARLFVQALCTESRLGPRELEQLQKLYKDPRPPRASPPPNNRIRKPALWLDSYHYDDWPEGYEDDAKSEQAAAEKHRECPSATHEVFEVFATSKPPWERYDTVIWIETEHPRRLVTPPGRVIDVRTWSNGKRQYWFTFAECPKKNRCSFDVMTERLGYGWKKRLSRFGRVNAETAGELLKWWDRRGTGR